MVEVKWFILQEIDATIFIIKEFLKISSNQLQKVKKYYKNLIISVDKI
jgi:hypothetical protein